jgi:hypothetical protein
MDNLDRYDNLVKILTEPVEIDGKEYSLKEDFEKFFIRENKTAGVRIRKVMQMIRNEAQIIRDNIQEKKKTI